MTHRTRSALLGLLVAATLLATAAPAGAQQPIDATEDGGAAFLAFAVMVFLIVGALFYMDRVRRRRSGDD
jgi:hypothetical protein